MALNFDLIFVPTCKRFQVSGVRKEERKGGNPKRMKLHQNVTVSFLYVKSEIYDITILDFIGFAFKPDSSFFSGVCIGPGFH